MYMLRAEVHDNMTGPGPTWRSTLSRLCSRLRSSLQYTRHVLSLWPRNIPTERQLRGPRTELRCSVDDTALPAVPNTNGVPSRRTARCGVCAVWLAFVLVPFVYTYWCTVQQHYEFTLKPFFDPAVLEVRVDADGNPSVPGCGGVPLLHPKDVARFYPPFDTFKNAYNTCPTAKDGVCYTCADGKCQYQCPYWSDVQDCALTEAADVAFAGSFITTDYRFIIHNYRFENFRRKGSLALACLAALVVAFVFPCMACCRWTSLLVIYDMVFEKLRDHRLALVETVRWRRFHPFALVCLPSLAGGTGMRRLFL